MSDDAGGLIPSPRLVAAWFVVGGLATERVPMWAAHWLADGHDGPALRELAGLDGADPREVRALIPAVLAETGEPLPAEADSELTTGRRAAYIALAYEDTARLFLQDRASARWVLDKVAEVVQDQDYGELPLSQPLGRLYGFDDEWDGGWGRSPEELTHAVRAACLAQVHGHDRG